MSVKKDETFEAQWSETRLDYLFTLIYIIITIIFISSPMKRLGFEIFVGYLKYFYTILKAYLYKFRRR